MGAVVIKEALKRAGVAPEQVDHVYMGCVIQAGLGQNVARQMSLKAGLPVEVPAVTPVSYTHLDVYKRQPESCLQIYGERRMAITIAASAAVSIEDANRDII